MTNRIDLYKLRMNHFNIQDAEFYCKTLNINQDMITELLLNNNKLEDINGVSIFKNLKILSFWGNFISDISPLKNLIKLETLDLSDNKNLSNISSLKNLINLKQINLSDNKNLSDISPLKNLINLETLDISDLNLTEELKTVKILKSLPILKVLWCGRTFRTVKIKNELKEKNLGIYD